MGLKKVAWNKHGKGFNSSRWLSREEAKESSRKRRRQEDKKEIRSDD